MRRLTIGTAAVALTVTSLVVPGPAPAAADHLITARLERIRGASEALQHRARARFERIRSVFAVPDERSNAVQGKFIGTDFFSDLPETVREKGITIGINGPLVGAIPDPVPLLLPAVIKIREARYPAIQPPPSRPTANSRVAIEVGGGTSETPGNVRPNLVVVKVGKVVEAKTVPNAVTVKLGTGGRSGTPGRASIVIQASAEGQGSAVVSLGKR